MQSVTLKVDGMSCGHCVKAVESSVGELNGVEKVNVSLADAEVAISFDEAQVSLDQIKETIEEEGYDIN